MFNTEYNGAHQRHRRARRGGAVRALARSSTSGPAASCRRATAPTSTARTTRTTGRSTPTASRTAIRSSSRAATTASCTGASSARSKLSGGVVRRRVGDRQHRRARRRPRPGRLLGHGRRLLPERHLLRRQEPARHRRRRPGAGRRQRRATSTSCSRRSSARRRRVHDRERVRQLRRARRLRRAATPTSDGAYVLGSYLFPKPVGTGKFEVLGKFAQGELQQGPDVARRRLRPEDDRVQLQLRHQGVQRARDVLLQEHATSTPSSTDFKQFGVGLQIQM